MSSIEGDGTEKLSLRSASEVGNFDPTLVPVETIGGKKLFKYLVLDEEDDEFVPVSEPKVKAKESAANCPRGAGGNSFSR
jgi:hypothetical protein